MKTKNEKTVQSEGPGVKRRKKVAIPGGAAPEETQQQPALTIAIQSWATPVAGLAMLIIGLVVGYYIRPLTFAQASPTTMNAPIVAVTPPAVLPTADQSAAQQNLMDSVIPKARHFKGDPNAPVTVIEFGDFQCPFCGRFFSSTEPQIDNEYIRSGKARFAYFNFAFLGAESTWAAEAAECAADQEKFWEYHDILYASQAGENQGAFNKDNLKKFAEELGLDTKAFTECLDSGKYTTLIQDDTSTSSALGVQSTPSFLINGQSVVGAQPFEVFQQTIDALLK